MIIDCIADLHGFYPKLEGGDLLIVAGDLTARDQIQEYYYFVDWIGSQNYKRKIVIGGNHDNLLKNHSIAFKNSTFEYLCDSGTEFEGLKIWGSPWTPLFKGVNPHCTAFMKPENELSDYWDKIPMGIHILVTHGPAFGILDEIPQQDGTLYHAGSTSLLGWLRYVERPLLHVFGHIHEAYGRKEAFASYDGKMVQSVNCSYVNEHYKPVNKPIRIRL